MLKRIKSQPFSYLVVLLMLLTLGLAACGDSTTAATSTTASSAATTAASSATTSAATTAASNATTAAAGGATSSIPYASCPNPGAALSGEIKIGVMGPLTGPSGPFGTAIKRGVDMAVEDVNKCGGINGKKLVTVEKDDKATADVGLTNIQQLIDNDKVFALVGTANTAVGLKQYPVVNSKKVPWLIPITTGSKITRDTDVTKRYTFRVSMQDAEQAPFVAEYVAGSGKYKTIALIHDDSGYGTLGRDDALNALKAKGITPVLTEVYKVGSNSEDMKPLINKLKSANADAVINWGLGAEAVNLKKAMKEVGFTSPMYGSWGLALPTFATLGAGLEEGTFVPQTFIVDTTTPKQQAFVARYREKYPDDKGVGFPSGLSQAYDCVQLLATAMRQPGADTDREKLWDALTNIGPYDGLVKSYQGPFKNEFHEALTRPDFKMTVWQGGKMVEVK